jgi:protein phosphatase
MQSIGLSHRGLKRRKNEDRYLIEEMADGSILSAVADGMGGEVAGEYAAEIMIDKLTKIGPSIKDKESHLSLLVKEADHTIRSEAESNSALEGMGTTVTSIFVVKEFAYWVHVGDSRLYLLRNHRLTQVTKDQNMAQFLFDEGEITHEEVPTHPMRNLLEQSVGCGDCQPVTGRLQIKTGDLLILATDGFFNGVNSDIIISLLTSKTDIENKAKSLVEAALDAGGKDNITVVVVQI